MAANPKKRRRMKRSLPLAGALFTAALFALNCVVSLSVLTPKKYELSLGLPAPETIVAPQSVEDTAATEALRQAARSGAAPVYTLDKAYTAELTAKAEAFFEAVSAFRSDAADLRAASAPAGGGEDLRSWRSVVRESELSTMLLRLPVRLTDAALGYALLDADESDVASLGRLVVDGLSGSLSQGVSEDTLEKVRRELSYALQITTLPTGLKTVGELVYDAYLQPTYVEDEAASNRAREQAANAVAAVRVARGAEIVKKGETVTESQLRILTALGMVSGVDERGLYGLGIAGFLLLAYLLFFVQLCVFDRETVFSSRRMLMLLLIVGLTLLLAWGCSLLDPRAAPAMLAVLLSAVLLGGRTASLVNLLTALTLGFMAGGGGATVLGADALGTTVSLLLAGQAAIPLAARNDRRGSLIAAGGVGGGVAAATSLAFAAMRGQHWTDALIGAGIAAVIPLILSVFCVGMLSLWENAFDLATPARLHELLNGNHPLLKKLMLSTPGTYNHSMFTASLAEAAAEQIGANALLARAGGMYHDVGKLKKPQYFKENQTGRNLHDTLPPEESAAAIIAHQRDADALLLRHRVPAAVRAIAREHHGTTLVAYFYVKAKKLYGEDRVQESQYRYPGPRPSSRESAIVMLADSCEAAVRSLGDPSPEEVAEMVKKIFRGKLEDGQLSECPITLQELDRVQRSFLVTFGGLMHERIRYPEDRSETKEGQSDG